MRVVVHGLRAVLCKVQLGTNHKGEIMGIRKDYEEMRREAVADWEAADWKGKLWGLGLVLFAMLLVLGVFAILLYVVKALFLPVLVVYTVWTVAALLFPKLPSPNELIVHALKSRKKD